MYYYPDNMASAATMWFWTLRDIAILGILLLLSVLALSQMHIMFPLVGSVVYGFLTMRFDNTSILDFIKYAAAFLIFKPQLYEWGLEDEP